MTRLLAYLQLLRLPTVFTAMADIFLGFLLQHGELRPTGDFVLILGASSTIYLAGMVFNDVFDRHVDAGERPGRPIPSGRVSVRSAAGLGGALILAGLICAALVGLPSLVVAGILTACMFGYDAGLKKTPAGPLTMGACRFLNVMLGASAVASTAAVWTLPQLHVAVGLGVYIIGVTWFARHEAGISRRGPLLWAMLLVNFGLVILLGYIAAGAGQADETVVLFVLAVIMFTINRRLAAAIADPVPHKVQTAIKTMLLSLVMLDASLILFATGNASYALATAALVIPAIGLSRLIAMT